MVAGGGCAWLRGGMHGCRRVCMVAGGHAWLLGGRVWLLGACMVVGGMRGCEGHAWLPGGMHGCRGVCMVAGGMHGCRGDVHGWGVCMVARGRMRRIRRDTVNERAVRILLECILVANILVHSSNCVLMNRNYSCPLVYKEIQKVYSNVKVF